MKDINFPIVEDQINAEDAHKKRDIICWIDQMSKKKCDLLLANADQSNEIADYCKSINISKREITKIINAQARDLYARFFDKDGEARLRLKNLAAMVNFVFES